MKTREIEVEVKKLAQEFPVVSIYGPRQSGKTTLARMAFEDKPWISFESPDHLMQARMDPRGLIESFPDGAIFDEIQRVPELLSYLQEYVDRDRVAGKFILTGSHQAVLKKGIAQSLAGRTAVVTLLPYSLSEIRQGGKEEKGVFDLILRGSYPALHETAMRTSSFYSAYVATYLEKDLPGLLELRNRTAFLEFLFLLATRVGQLFNATSIANDIGVSAPTILQWVSVLEASNIVFRLRGWSRNATMQVTKSPKIYFTDTGLAAWLAKAHRVEDVQGGMIRGGLYENYVILEIYKHLLNGGDSFDLYFYRDKAAHEVDLIVEKNGKVIPIEIKSSSTFSPDFTKGIKYFNSINPQSANGIVLFNGSAAPAFQGVRVMNLLQTDLTEISGA